MAMWGRGTGSSSDVLVDCPGKGAGALSPHASATPPLFASVYKNAEIAVQLRWKRMYKNSKAVTVRAPAQEVVACTCSLSSPGTRTPVRVHARSQLGTFLHTVPTG